MQYTINNRNFWLLFLLCAMTLVPFLGLPQYHTKGEPREAIVSYTMIVDDNWTLPRNNGGEMAYKPPFFHWCVAMASIVRGDMTEGATRMPSALALIAMTMAGFIFFARRKGEHVGVLAALVAFTTFELHRAGGNCRVDMVLTAATVFALYMFYRWYERDMKEMPSLILAILAMGVGTLTKGPVGSIIPCLVMGVYMLLRGTGFFKTLGLMMLFGLLSLIPYALWFYAAWTEGGQEFLDLMYEENIGRMTNTMGYDSCVQPWPYNFLTVFLGFLPWTVMLIVSLFFLHYSRPRLNFAGWWHRLTSWVRKADPVDLFALTATIVIFVFYCIPQSKRSVYLMPIYPFLSYFIARYMLWMASHKPRVMRIYGGILSVLSLLVFVLFLVIKSGVIPEDIFTGRHARENALMLIALSHIGLWWQWLLLLMPTVFALYWWIRRKDDDLHNISAVFVMTFGLYIALDGVYSPVVLNTKSVRTMSIRINHAAPESEGPLYEYIESGVKAKGDPLHFFEVNFYLRNRIRNFYKEKPSEGFLLISKGDAERNFGEFRSEGYTFRLRFDTGMRDMQVYEFRKAVSPGSPQVSPENP